MFRLVLLSLSLSLFNTGISFAEDFSGKARVVDGDTIYVGSTKVRVFGIDAPEQKQTCTHNKKQWNCGEQSTFALANIIGNHWVECIKKDVDRYRRIVATCYTGPYDIAKKMVLQGWAIAYRRYSKDYVADEEIAEQNKVGMWRGEFVKPWEWRR